MKFFCSWIAVHIAALVVCMLAMGLLSLIFPIPNWHMVAVGIWFIACFAGLCIPDDVWKKWLPGSEV